MACCAVAERIYSGCFSIFFLPVSLAIIFIDDGKDTMFEIVYFDRPYIFYTAYKTWGFL
jgi:hypothetical protein